MSKLIRFSALLLVTICLINGKSQAQVKSGLDTVQSGLYDMGKMWTFDFPPIDYFKNTYNFSPDQKWFEEARLSSLRFGNGCSASFVSSDGLVMTNHHCARASGTSVQKPGENFNENGFYALTLTEERRITGLFVDQLIKIEDITDRVVAAMAKDENISAKVALRTKEFEAITQEYKAKDGWKDLEIQPETFYNGGKYALYGFKRYKDVRLVFMPEMHLGFFGGDYDNFTYPRYDLDCSFFRVYDDNGKPMKTPHFFKFNQAGPSEGDPVFIIGNPGSTRRLSTISDLEFNRDVVFPMQLNLFRNRSKFLQEYNKTAKNDSITNVIFGLENSFKARHGELAGLEDPYLMARKAAFEKNFKADAMKKPELANQVIIWDNIAKDNQEAKGLYPETSTFSVNPRSSGELIAFANALVSYSINSKTDATQAGMVKKMFTRLKPAKVAAIEEGYMAAFLQEALAIFGKNDPYVVKALNGQTPKEAAARLLKTTKLNDPQVRADLLSKDVDFIDNFSDPLLDLARIGMPRGVAASAKFRAIQDRLSAYRSQLGRMLFDIYGTSIPPDATFSLRISDGVVKGYEYNGTMAPAKTTFYGLYDRYFSFNKQYPWYLPKKWQNPPAELLPVPLDFVSTNDIIGGNSGSPMINKNLEVIGLVFDGNMESLPGGFIFIPDANRSVGVTSVGMLGALEYIYKAKRLRNELLGK
jgi:hypothetical protein